MLSDYCEQDLKKLRSDSDEIIFRKMGFVRVGYVEEEFIWFCFVVVKIES